VLIGCTLLPAPPGKPQAGNATLRVAVVPLFVNFAFFVVEFNEASPRIIKHCRLTFSR